VYLLQQTVAEEDAENSPPEWADIQSISLLDKPPIFIDPIGLIDAARYN